MTLNWTTSTAGDSHRYELGTYIGFRDDEVAAMGIDDIARLAQSPDWEDRLRGQYLLNHCKILLPDGFPCIFEPVDSPAQSHNGRLARVTPWVVSPDQDMLTDLLPEYQAMWDDYVLVQHHWWGPDARRTFVVGTLDELPSHGVFRVGTTVDDVLRKTANLHGMRLPERLRGDVP